MNTKFFIGLLVGLSINICSATTNNSLNKTSDLLSPADEIQKLTNELAIISEKNKLCFYVGSFDPFHSGHDNIVKTSLEHECCTNVVVYASGGVFRTKPNRLAQNIRNKMIVETYKDNPKVITSLLAPDAFYKVTSNFQKDSKLNVTGIIGEDTAIALCDAQESDTFFLSNIENLKLKPNKNKANILFSNNAFEANKFIIAPRSKLNEFDFKTSCNSILGKPYSILPPHQFKEISSTKIRSLLKEGKQISDLVPRSVEDIITTNHLYTLEAK